MPRSKPLRFEVTPKDKAFLYNTIRTFYHSRTFEDRRYLKRGKDVLKLALKFPPGTSPVRLQDWERRVIVQWLLKLHKLAQVRENDILKDRFKKLIQIFK